MVIIVKFGHSTVGTHGNLLINYIYPTLCWSWDISDI